MSDVKPILSTRGLMKRYGTVVAMNGADFDLYPGEITAVIGDNGAGKSTLIKAIAGAVIPDHGEITLEGKVVNFKSPQDARSLGIDPASLIYMGQAMTANGVVKTATVTLRNVSFGPFVDAAVTAQVNETEMEGSLLGMDYLGRFSVTMAEDQMILTR